MPNEGVWTLDQTAVKAIHGTPNNTVQFGALWDENYLYVAADVTDGALYNDSADIWNDDSVEIYIDGGNEKAGSYDNNDRQYIKGWNDASIWEKNGNTTGVQHAWAAKTEAIQRACDTVERH